MDTDAHPFSRPECVALPLPYRDMRLAKGNAPRVGNVLERFGKSQLVQDEGRVPTGRSQGDPQLPCLNLLKQFRDTGASVWKF